MEKITNQELHNLYSLPNIIRVITSRRMRQVGHVAWIGRWKIWTKILVRRP